MLQLVQLVYTVSHVKQLLSQAVHSPLLITRGVGQEATQDPLYRAALEAQLVQLSTVPAHYAHSTLQASHSLVTAFVIVMPAGHELSQTPK